MFVPEQQTKYKTSFMRNFYSAFTRLAITISALLFFAPAKAITYTAMVSGNFSNTTTWGGLVPLSLTAGDIILIPVGVTVTLDNNITLNNSATLIVDGTLASASNTTALILVNSSLSGSGTIAIDSMSVDLPSGFGFTGNITAEHFTTVSTNIVTSANINVAGNLYIAGALSTLSAGTITLGNNTTIIIRGGNLSVTGTGVLDLSANYTVSYQGNTSVNTGIELTGTGLNGISLDMNGGTVLLSSDLLLNTTLTMNSGDLVLNGFDLTLGSNSDLVVNGTGTINSDLNSDITINCNNNLTSSLPLHSANNVIHDLTINMNNITGNFILGSDIVISGLVTLSSGTLNLNGNDLTFAGGADFANTGIGGIWSSASSNIAFMTMNNMTGSIRFRPGGNMVNNLTMNLPYSTNSVILGSSLTVAGTLSLSSGMLDLGPNNLTVALSGNVTGGSVNSYVITSNGGNLVMNMTADESNTWHIGTGLNYAPAILLASSTCATSDISIGVDDEVLSSGYFGTDISNTCSMVDAAWSVSSSVTAGLNLDLQFQWSANMELNSFDRTKAYISQYKNNVWDLSTTTSASSVGSMYSMNRGNVTSPGIFTVVDENSALKTRNLLPKEVELVLYPNPAVDVIRFTTSAVVETIDILDITGKKVNSFKAQGNSFSVSELAPGYYNATISGKNFITTKHFIKAN
jgi:hypothetical protein